MVSLKLFPHCFRNFDSLNRFGFPIQLFNDLGYIKDIPKFLADLRKKMNKNAKFCFYVKHTIADISPNALIFEDRKKLVEVFKEAKLKAEYYKKKRLFKEEIFVFGKKN